MRRLDDFFALHRFALQAAIPPTATTHALYLSTLTVRRLPNDAVHHLRLVTGFISPDPKVYSLLMAGFVGAGDGARAVELYEELKDKVGVSQFLMASCMVAL
jgi:pentatricopeptide repeat protein